MIIPTIDTGLETLLRTELPLVKNATRKPWGVGFITWSTSTQVLQWVLAQQPHAVMLSFGDPRPHAALVKHAGCKLICQVQKQPISTQTPQRQTDEP